MISTQTLFHRLVATLLVFVATISTALADDSGTGWSYASSTQTLTLSGSNVDWTAIEASSLKTEHVVFDDDYTVSGIPERAFEGFYYLTAIDIPDVVTEISDSAFLDCFSLTSITLPSTLTSIGERAFDECNALQTVEILSNGTSDDQHVIYLGSDTGDKTATSVDVFPIHQATLIYDPNTTWIGDEATQNLRYYFSDFAYTGGTGWSYDSSTNTLTLSGSNVDRNAIKYFSSTTEKVVFAKNYSVSSIPNGTFKGFSKLAAIDISSVVTSIGNSAFYGCTSLASVSFSTSLISIDMAAFDGCTSLTSISLPDGLQSVGTGAFYGCTALSSVSLPASLTSISYGAFFDCTSLTSVTIPEGLYEIEGQAFYGCTALTSISFPASLTLIGLWAFEGCTSLNSVEILSNGTSDNKHVIYLGYGTEDETSTGGDEVFPLHQATLIYDPNTTWIGDNDSQNLRFYFNKFSVPTSIHSNTISTSAPQYYDLSGRPVSPTTHKGIAVKLQDGNSSLISIK